MSNKPKKRTSKKMSIWLKNLYYIGTLLSLCFIMLQVFFARRSMIQSSEWEKAKLTIENIERFKENLKETALYENSKVLPLAGRQWPDLTTPKGYELSDTLRKTYESLFDGKGYKLAEDFENTLAILDAFAYPIIMGYASEIGSMLSVPKEFVTYGNYIIPRAFHQGGYALMGSNAKLLHRLWRIRGELGIINLGSHSQIEVMLEKQRLDLNPTGEMTDFLLCFDGVEITPATLKQYEKKLEKELKKIEKEIKEFRKMSLK